MNQEMPKTRPDRSRGQVLVIFAGALFLLMMMSAVVVDISWYWVNSLKVQRAADAAAMAGAVMLPNEPSAAYSLAREEARRNGYIAGGGVVVTPAQDAGNPRRLNVTIQAPVGTFFMRVIGIGTINVARTAKAEFTLPVPMGSPQNYYGVGPYYLPTTSTTQVGGSTGWRTTNDEPNNGGNWIDEDEVVSNDGDYAYSETSNGSAQQWDEWNLLGGSGGIPNSSSLVFDGLEVQIRDRLYNSGGNLGGSSNCRLGIEVSWNNGSSGSWTPMQQTPPLSTSSTEHLDEFGSNNSFADWGSHNWTRTDFDRFRVRLTFLKGSSSSCGSNRRAMVDEIEVRVTYHTTQTVTNPPSLQPVISPNGQVLAPQNFWGAMQSQGAPSVQGDAYMAGYATRKNPANPTYEPLGYYNYGIDIPAGGGQVWIFDPGFCDTSPDGSVDVNQGTGESWTVSNNNTGSNGADRARPVSAQFNLFRDDANTPYNYADDVLVGSSGNTFRRLFLTDPDLGGNSGGDYGNPADCGSLSWHNAWWSQSTFQNLPAGRYRLHTTSRIYSNPSTGQLDNSDDQTDSTGLNAFAIWTTASGSVAPRVYGLGAMEAYFPLPAGQASSFYLAQIEGVHAGKWVDIDLWDPGDTGGLRADLSILWPTTSGYATAPFYYNSSSGTNLPSNFACGSNTSSLVSSIRTSDGSGSRYNGEWLRLCVKVPNDYTGPQPPGEQEPGWWKIRYTMGNGSSPATDLTTWQVTVRGNPVHLIIP